MPAPARGARHFWLLAAVAVAGCGPSKNTLSHENDRLRALAHDLERTNKRLDDRITELEAALREASASASFEGVPPEVMAAVPHVVTVDIDRRSHVEDGDGDGRPESLVLYLKTRDGRARFVQAVGTLTADAAVIEPGRDAITVGRIILGPADVRDAWRSSFMGTNYTVTVPLDLTAAPDAAELIAQIEFIDGQTGRRIVEHRSIEIPDGRVLRPTLRP